MFFYRLAVGFTDEESALEAWEEELKTKTRFSDTCDTLEKGKLTDVKLVKTVKRLLKAVTTAETLLMLTVFCRKHFPAILTPHTEDVSCPGPTSPENMPDLALEDGEFEVEPFPLANGVLAYSENTV